MYIKKGGKGGNDMLCEMIFMVDNIYGWSKLWNSIIFRRQWSRLSIKLRMLFEYKQLENSHDLIYQMVNSLGETWKMLLNVIL